MKIIYPRRVIVNTEYNPKSIPTRKHDWDAWLDSYDGGNPGEPYGHGETESEAVMDLYEQIAAKEEEEEERHENQR